MMKNHFMACAMLASLAGCSTSGNADTAITIAAGPSPDPSLARDRVVMQIYRDARTHDIRALEAMRPASPDPAIALALFDLDRNRFAQDFIRTYPVSPDGVNGDYGTRLSRARLTRDGERFPIDALASFAAASTIARERLLLALAHSDDARLPAYAEASGRVFVRMPPEAALAAFVALPVAERLAVTSEVDWCSHRPDRILAFVPTPVPTSSATGAATAASSPSVAPTPSPTPPPLVLVQNQIRHSLRTCRPRTTMTGA